MISSMSIGLNLASPIDMLPPVILLGLSYASTAASKFVSAKAVVDEHPSPDSTSTAVHAEGEMEGFDDHSTRGIFRASFGSHRVHSLVIHSEEETEEDDLVTEAKTDSVIYSPHPHPTPSSIRSGNSQQSQIKRQSYPAFRMPASPPEPVAPHWSRLVSSSLDSNLSPVSSNSSSMPSPLESPLSPSDSSDVSHETNTESPLSPYSSVDDKWHSAIYGDSAVLTSGHEACVQLSDGVEGDLGLGLSMRVASSMQSIWDGRLIVPPNSPMMGDGLGCVPFPTSPNIDLDELDLRFIGRPTTPTIPRPTSSKIHRRLLRPFILRRMKASVKKHVETESLSSSPDTSPSRKALSNIRSGNVLRHMFRFGANAA